MTWGYQVLYSWQTNEITTRVDNYQHDHCENQQNNLTYPIQYTVIIHIYCMLFTIDHLWHVSNRTPSKFYLFIHLSTTSSLPHPPSLQYHHILLTLVTHKAPTCLQLSVPDKTPSWCLFIPFEYIISLKRITENLGNAMRILTRLLCLSSQENRANCRKARGISDPLSQFFPLSVDS